MSDLTLETVKWRNFASFGAQWTEVDLSRPGTSHVLGENLDEGGSSGAGKSTLFNVICYCLYDKLPGDDSVPKNQLVNNINERADTVMEVLLTLTLGADRYVVRRFRGAQTGVSLARNGVDVTPAHVADLNAALTELVGFSYALFTRVVLFDGNARPFLSFGVGEQRALIEELLKLTVLSRKAQALKVVITATERDVELRRLLVDQQEAQNTAHRRHVGEAQERAQRWTAQRAAELKRLRDDAEALAAFDFASEGQLHVELVELERGLTALRGEVALLSARRTALERERPASATELALLERELARVAAHAKLAEGELTHLRASRCPYCLQAFAGSEARAGELETSLRELEAKGASDGARAVELRTDHARFTADQQVELAALSAALDAKQLEQGEAALLTATVKQAVTYRSLAEAVTAQGRLERLQAELARAAAETNPHLEAVAALEAEGETPVDRAGIDAAHRLLAHQRFLLKLLTDKGSYIRKNLISRTLPFLNQRIGGYAEQLNLPHVVTFNPDMTCGILRYGRELDHGLMSRGERKRLNLALCLAFRDVLTYLRSRVNVLFTDEVDGGSLSGPDVEALVGLLKRKAFEDSISVFVVSHRPEFDDRCDRTLVVRKERGFSTLIEQPDA